MSNMFSGLKGQQIREANKRDELAPTPIAGLVSELVYKAHPLPFFSGTRFDQDDD